MTQQPGLSPTLQAKYAMLQEQLQALEQELTACQHEQATLSQLYHQQTQELERRNQFLRDMSHTLRTSLNAILGLSQALQEGIYGPLTTEQIIIIQSIETSGTQLLPIVEELQYYLPRREYFLTATAPSENGASPSKPNRHPPPTQNGHKLTPEPLPEPTYTPTDNLIMLAEDNELNIVTLAGYLEDKGYHVVIAHNGAEVLQRLPIECPALVLMDMQMPRMDGFEATRTIRTQAEFATLPIIAMTALALPEDREDCLTAGATDYLSKPVDFTELLTMIEHQIGKPTSPANNPHKS